MRKKHYFNFFRSSNLIQPNLPLSISTEEDIIKKIIALCDEYLIQYPQPKILPAPPLNLKPAILPMPQINDADSDVDDKDWMYHKNTHPSTIVFDIKAIANNNCNGFTYGKRLELIVDKLHDESVQHIMTKSSALEKFVNTVKNVLKALFTFNFKDIFKSQDKIDTYHKIDKLISI